MGLNFPPPETVKIQQTVSVNSIIHCSKNWFPSDIIKHGLVFSEELLSQIAEEKLPRCENVSNWGYS